MYTEADSLDPVPNAPKNLTHSVRFEKDDWADLGALAAAMGTDRSKVINQFIRWYLRRPGAKLPERPGRQGAGK